MQKWERTAWKKQGENQKAAPVPSSWNLCSLSVRKLDHPYWGSAHLMLLTTQIMPSERVPGVSQLAGEAAESISTPTLPGKGSHSPL